MEYSNVILEYHNNQIKTIYTQLCNCNPNIFLSTGFETGSFELIKSITYQISALAHSLFIKLSMLINKLTKDYAILFDKYVNILNSNRENIDITKFSNSKITCTNYITTVKRLQTVTHLFTILNNIDSVVSAPGNWDTPEIKKSFDLLINIGFDTNSQSLINKPSPSYTNDEISQTILQHQYTLDKIFSLVEQVKQLEKYTKSSYIVNLNKKFTSISQKLVEQKRAANQDSNIDQDKIKTQLIRIWWCSHFIKAVYTISNDIVSTMLKLCKAAVNSIKPDED